VDDIFEPRIVFPRIITVLVVVDPISIPATIFMFLILTVHGIQGKIKDTSWMLKWLKMRMSDVKEKKLNIYKYHFY